MSELRIEFIDSIGAIAAADWNAIAGTDYPFTRHEFLHSLEASGCADKDSGWQPQHILVTRANRLIAVMPLYLKFHSYGEYVFDWSWADAYHRHGKNYYPKYLAAIPFTPATGPRLCIAAGENMLEVAAQIVATIKQRMDKFARSSLHVLFPQPDFGAALSALGLSERSGAQYHWYNHNFSDFDDFLATFNSRKRKNVRKERARIAEQNLQLKTFFGAQILAEHWRIFYRFYELTYAKLSGHSGYLNAEFFRAIGEKMPEHIVMTLAYHADEAIAGALYFRDSTTLYGRYWGCAREFDCLHFETCYYQGIDYCIRNGLQHFDPGAQGEHKIARGFTPIKTHSYHWLGDRDFRAAVDHFLVREQRAIEMHLQEATAALPFKNSADN